MLVKIGETIYDPENQPIMLILTKEDKKNIKNMSKLNDKYLQYPDTMSDEEAKAFMKT